MQKGATGGSQDSTTPEPRPLDTVEMFVSVFCFIKDSALVSQTLLDDFRTCQVKQQLTTISFGHSRDVCASTVLCFIKDSALVSQTLLDDFRTCQVKQQLSNCSFGHR
jgi:hypothetical protein